MGMSAFLASTEEKIAVQNLGTLFISCPLTKSKIAESNLCSILISKFFRRYLSKKRPDSKAIRSFLC
jgi:hypothetical protein